jgi:hypothetical protein
MNRWGFWFGSFTLGIVTSTAGADTPTPKSSVSAGEAKPSAMAKAAEALKAGPVQPAAAQVNRGTTAPLPTVTVPPPSVPPPVISSAPLDEPVRWSGGYHPEFFAVEAEYLLWKYRGTTLPPLVSSGSSVLFGNQEVNKDAMNGGRLRIVGAEDEYSLFSWDIAGFFLAPQSTKYGANSNQASVLGRPYYDTIVGSDANLLVGFPGAFRGGVYATLQTTFYGAETNVGMSTSDGNQTGFAGIRYAYLEDFLNIKSQYEVLPGGAAFINGRPLQAGATGILEDRITARTQFYGGQIGYRGHFGYRGFGLDLRASIALGASVSEVRVVGATSVTDVNGVTPGNGGLLGQISNGPQKDRATFAVLPEVSARVSYRFTDWFSVYAGYDFMYWSSVTRAADQVDRRIDTRALPTSANYNGQVGPHPHYPGTDTNFWAHGINFGMRFQY